MAPKRTLPYSTADWEGIRGGSIKSDGALHFLMEGGDEGEEFWWAADLLKDLEEPTTTDQVKGFCQIHKSEEQWLLLLTTLLLQLAEGEDHIHCGSAGSEATLGLWINSRS